ncbi:conserved hypothetical protein [Altererythrobacter sp. B11]|uniref:glutathione S-transferase family protein n=1 Tax=Altererythrobacter sp. B11 TaxID=2060312 RepID=UPI000DC7420B|nr:glutathione S-transferase family protein [Altererythrobacter sp. B11]BBC72543.1 conserved hypothetical protein [Altererythrobacter sp. B11]
MIALYHGGPAGHSAAVLIVLAEKGADYESRPLDLAGFEQHGEELLALNHAGQVPVLVADGAVLTESFFILQWIDECFPHPPLGGADPRARYQVNRWGKYVETHIAPQLAILRWAVLGDGTPPPLLARLPEERRALWQAALAGFGEDAVAGARAALDKAAARIADAVADGGWLAGADCTLADLAVYPHAAQFSALDIALPDAAQRWLDRVAARPAVRAAAGELAMVPTMGPEAGRWG